MYKLTLLTFFAIVLLACNNEASEKNAKSINEPEKLDTTQEIQESQKRNFQEPDIEEKKQTSIIERYNFSELGHFFNPSDTVGLYEKTLHLYEFNKHNNSFDKHYHFFDIDQDGDLDLLYDGWSGSEPMMFEISMNIDGEFKKLFKDYIYVKEIFFNNDSIIDSLIINDPGCCAAMTKSYRYYNLKTEKDTVSAELKLEEVFHHAEQKPKSYFDKPINFEIDNEFYWLRITPKIDTSEWYTEEWIGNRFLEFHKGDKGVALAEEKDSTGRIWWYSRLPYKKTYVHGWMSSRYLNKE